MAQKNRHTNSNLEQYWTPSDAIDPYLQKLANHLKSNVFNNNCIKVEEGVNGMKPSYFIIEPFAGDGGLKGIAKYMGNDSKIWTNDIDSSLDCDAHFDVMGRALDYSNLAYDAREEFKVGLGDKKYGGSLVVTNPPYSVYEKVEKKVKGEMKQVNQVKHKASNFIKQLMWCHSDADCIVALLRLNFLEKCEGREDLLQAHNIKTIDGWWGLSDVLITPRFKFMPGAGSDSMTTAFFIWKNESITGIGTEETRLTWL